MTITVSTSALALCRGEEQVDSLLQSLRQAAESQLKNYKVSMGCVCTICAGDNFSAEQLYRICIVREVGTSAPVASAKRGRAEAALSFTAVT